MGGDTQAGAENASEERPQNNPLSRKINKILETRLENDKVDMYMLYIFFFRSHYVLYRTRKSEVSS